MNILYTFNETFLPQVAASVTSICENCRKMPEIHFYMMALLVSESELEKLRSHIRSYERPGIHRLMTVIPITNVQDHIDMSFDTTGWNSIVLARLFADRLLPPDLDRILYLDGDTIVRHSLKKLWNSDLKGAAIGACMEPTCDKKRKTELGLTGLPYFNAGVLLVDLDQWRRQETGKEIMDFYRARNGRLFANDQDAINGSQKGEICSLSITYNYHNTYDLYPYCLLEKNCDYPVPEEKQFHSIRRDPCIIHYMGEERPWRRGNRHRFRKSYLKYLNKTPWRGKGFEDGWRLYFFFWNIFNLCMKPFPMIRLKVINSLIPLVLKIRAKKGAGK